MVSPGHGSAGAHLGQHVARRRVLGACLEDERDDLEEPPFRPGFDRRYLPAAVDLRRWMTPVEDEGVLGTASASALAGAVEYLVQRESGRHADVSRLFIYYNQRLLTDHVRQDHGASLRSGVRVLSRLGVPHERMWPYAVDLLAVQPPEGVYAAAAQHRIVDYVRVPVELEALKSCLAGGIPIAVGLLVFRGFNDVSATGLVSLPAGGEPCEGRHALLLVGYSEREQRFIARNSWGAGWGADGYCYLPYGYVADPRLTHTAWALRTTTDVTFEEAEHKHPGSFGAPASPEPQPGAAPPGAPGAAAPGGVPQLFGPTAFPAFGGGAPLAAHAMVPPVAAGSAPAAPFPVAAMKPPGLLGSLGALALGRKSPMELALELASHHSKGLVTRFTGSEAAGHVVGGLVQQFAPAVKAGAPYNLGHFGGALLGAHAAGAQPAPAQPSTPGGPPPGARAQRDPGVLIGADQSARVLSTLLGFVAPHGASKHHWDDTYDEHALVPADAPSPIRPAITQPKPAPTLPAPLQHQTGDAGRPVAGGAVHVARPLMGTGAGPAVTSAPAARGTQLMPAMVAPATVKLAPGQQLLDHWRKLGGATGPLGRVSSAELALSDGIGRGLLCQNGAIVWHPDRGPIEVVSTLFEAWTRSGAERGPLGYPVAPEVEVESGPWRARVARFENGIIADWAHPGAEDIPAFLVLSGDPLYAAWVQSGAEASAVGVPVSPAQELGVGGARALLCSSGAVGWTPQEGPAVLTGRDCQAWFARFGR